MIWRIVAPVLNPASSSAYLDDFETATSVVWAEPRAVSPTGPYLPDDILEAIKLGKRLLLVEGVKPTDAHLVLKIQTRPGNASVAAIPLPVSISGVEEMSRQKYVPPSAPDLTLADMPLSPPNCPDTGRNGRHLVFVHGYSSGFRLLSIPSPGILAAATGIAGRRLPELRFSSVRFPCDHALPAIGCPPEFLRRIGWDWMG